MIPDNFKSLIKKLIEKTESRNAIWGTTSNYYEFKIELSKSTIAIRTFFDQNEDSNYYGLAIFNEAGEKIEDMLVSDGDEDKDGTQLLVKLYDAARRAYYKVDETIRNISTELDSDAKIGDVKKPDKEKIADDDLPF